MSRIRVRSGNETPGFAVGLKLRNGPLLLCLSLVLLSKAAAVPSSQGVANPAQLDALVGRAMPATGAKGLALAVIDRGQV